MATRKEKNKRINKNKLRKMGWGNNHEIKKEEVEIVNIINRYILLFKKRERMKKKEKCI